MNVHWLIREIRETRPRAYESFSLEQKRKLLEKCVNGTPIKKAFREVKNEAKQGNSNGKDS